MPKQPETLFHKPVRLAFLWDNRFFSGQSRRWMFELSLNSPSMFKFNCQLYTFMNAAEIQFNALAAAHGVENLVVPPKHVLDQVQRYVNSANITEKTTDKDHIEWKTGEMEFEANMRRLDLLVANHFFRILILKLSFNLTFISRDTTLVIRTRRRKQSAEATETRTTFQTWKLSKV